MYMRYRIGLAPGHTGIWPSQLAQRDLKSIKASTRRRAGDAIPQRHNHKGTQTEGGDDDAEDDEGELSDSDRDSDDTSDSDDGEDMDIDENERDEEMYGYDSS
jgi:hypothetical protein